MKFSTASVTIREMFSPVSRDSTWISSPEAGSVADRPALLASQDDTATTPARITNSQNGSGSLLPTFSIQPRKPDMPSCWLESWLGSSC